MGKFKSRGYSKDAATKNWRRREYLKTGIVALITIAICGWIGYRLLTPGMTERYNDFTIDSAVDWLENADRDKFDICRKDIADADGWFNLFMRDRRSLGKAQSRSFSSRQDLPTVESGMKRYELRFGSSFSKVRTDIQERLIVESDGKSKFQVINAGYWLYYLVPDRAVKRVLTADEKQQIMTVADNVLKKIDARDTAFFRQTYNEWAQRPDYFHWKNSMVNEAKSCKNITTIYEILAKGKASPRKFSGINTFVPVGRSGFECSNAYYSFSVISEGQTRSFTLNIGIDRDLYEDKSAEWKFFNLWIWERKEKITEKKK
ncbi:MAG: hypothetical protein ACYC4Q_05135 [Victivallaceae bacterium]